MASSDAQDTSSQRTANWAAAGFLTLVARTGPWTGTANLPVAVKRTLGDSHPRRTRRDTKTDEASPPMFVRCLLLFICGEFPGRIYRPSAAVSLACGAQVGKPVPPE